MLLDMRSYLVVCILHGILADELQFDQLKQLLCIWDTLEDGV